MTIRILLWSLLCAALAMNAVARADAPRAHVDRTVVSEDETLTLTIDVPDVDVEPDLTPLETDFEIFNSARNSRVSIVHGRVESRNEWVLTLQPKHAGDLRIPPLPVDGQRTEAIDVKVVAGKAGGDARRDVFIEVGVEPRSGYVQSEFLYGMKLFVAVNLKDAALHLPDVPDAVVERLGDDATRDVVRDGRRYRVLERRYALYPQKSGTLRVPAPEFRGQMLARSASSRDALFGGLFGSDPFGQLTAPVKPVRARGHELSVDVQPKPKEAGDAWWLPARDVRLSEEWTAKPPQFRVGEPVTRTIVVEADGVTAQQLPEIPRGEVSGFKSYPDQPVKETQATAAGVTARATQKVAWVATQPGRHTLPALEIRWWDTQRNRMQTAALAALTVEVVPAPDAASATAPVAPPPLVAPVETPADEGADATPRAPAVPWRTLSAVLFVGWMLTVVLWAWKARSRPARAVAKTAEAREPPTLAPAVRAVTEACKNADVKALRRALLDYAAARWSDAPPHNLFALAARAPDERTRHAVLLVERRLYGRDGETWPAKAVCAEIVRWVNAEREELKSSDSPRRLHELYPKPEKS